MPQMDELTLKAILKSEKASAAGDVHQTGGDDLSSQRAKAMDYYQADMDEHIPRTEGRSGANSTDVADTVDTIMPALMDIFMGSDEVVRFNPVGAEDEDAALQETDFINHSFFVDNDGFVTLHGFIKDALIQKNGHIKYWWDEGDEEERETYESLTDDGFALLMAEDSVEMIEHSESPGFDENGEPTTLHDAAVKRKKPFGKVTVMGVPPEEFLIARNARSIDTSRYCAHVVKKTRSDLIDEGYDRLQVEQLPAGTQVSGGEKEARATVEDDDDELLSSANKAMEEIEVTEHYIRVDFDGDGIAELRKVTTAGSAEEILMLNGKPDNEPYDRMPFASITPILMSHRFAGRSLADLVMDIQDINTALTRAGLDNVYYLNNNRLEVADSHTNANTMDDILTPRPGAPIRTKAPGGISPVAVTPIIHAILPMIEHMKGLAETRTGVSRFNAGPDANSLNPFNSTATGANIVASAGQQRIRLIARTMAETGIKDLFLGMHELHLKHGTQARQVKLRNKWVTVDPRQWKTRKDMTVTVGLGTGTRDQLDAQLTRILATQVKAIELQQGVDGPLVKLGNVHHTLTKLVENAGFRDAEPFYEEPPEEDREQPRQQAPDPKLVEAQGKLELQAQKQAGEQQLKQAELVADQQQNVASLEAKRQEAALEAQVAVYKAELDAQTELRIAGLKADLDAQVAEMRAELETAIAVRKQNVDADAKVRAGGQIG